MRESILTIPVNEVFEPREGCPICRMRDTVEEHICEYIMGAAMMEPDVRQDTNRLGFCFTHYQQLIVCKAEAEPVGILLYTLSAADDAEQPLVTRTYAQQSS